MRGQVDVPLRLLEQAPPGPRIEFGVYQGETLRAIADHMGPTIGVDSFEGMSRPTERDFDPERRKHHYPKGKHRASMHTARALVPTAMLVRGFVPEVLPEVPDGPYAFVHLDMDQYVPTKAALEWAWGRMLPGGIVAAHDFYPDRTWLAAGALNEWREKHPESGIEVPTIWWVR